MPRWFGDRKRAARHGRYEVRAARGGGEEVGRKRLGAPSCVRGRLSPLVRPLSARAREGL